MLEYRMMDEDNLLPSCLHSGPIPIGESAGPACAEREYGLPDRTIARFLEALCRAYGSCGVMAIDENLIVGKIRFCPHSFSDSLTPDFLCVQAEDGARLIESFALAKLVPKDHLPSRSVFVLCLQVVPLYRGLGIAGDMLATLIQWAEANGWDRVRAKATHSIKPLLECTGMWSVDAYRRLGFQVTGHAPSEELTRFVADMRAGDHGEEVRRQWEPHGHFTDGEASWLYDVTL